MTGQELKLIRLSLGLSQTKMGREIGYQGKDRSIQVLMCQFESGQRPIPSWRVMLINQLKERRQ